MNTYIQQHIHKAYIYINLLRAPVVYNYDRTKQFRHMNVNTMCAKYNVKSRIRNMNDLQSSGHSERHVDS